MSRGPRSWLLLIISTAFPGSFSLAQAAENQAEKELDTMVVDWLRPLFETVSANPWIQSVIVIVITFTCASLLTWLIFRIISAITRRTHFVFDDQIALILRPPIYFSLVVIGLTAGINLMPLEAWKLYLIRGMRTIGIVIWVVFCIRLASLLLKRVAGLSNKFTFIQHRTVTLFDNLAKLLLVGIAC